MNWWIESPMTGSPRVLFLPHGSRWLKGDFCHWHSWTNWGCSTAFATEGNPKMLLTSLTGNNCWRWEQRAQRLLKKSGLNILESLRTTTLWSADGFFFISLSFAHSICIMYRYQYEYIYIYILCIYVYYICLYYIIYIDIIISYIYILLYIYI